MTRLALPFLDSAGKADEHGPDIAALIRPWQSFWPPEAGSELHLMLQRSVPEVLTWRFDPKKPLDRPWQSWTKAAIQSGKACTSQLLQPATNGTNEHNLGLGEDDGEQGTRAGLEEAGTGEEAIRVLQTEQLDLRISGLKLPYTIPSQFNYLAEDPLYRTTKPFHTRLPFMGEIRRSNIVAQGYSSVKIHDIRGLEDEFTLDKSGFQYCSVPANISQWTDDTVRELYLPAMESWLKDFFQVSRVHIFTTSVSSTGLRCKTLAFLFDV
jgi:hypothetical protein